MPYNTDIIIISNAKGVDTSCVGNVHRLPLIHALADKIKTTGKILVVAAPISLLTALFNDLFRLVSYFFTPKQRKIGENIFVLFPLTFFPVSVVDHWPITRKFFRDSMHRQLRNAMTRSGFLPMAQRVLWVTHPYHIYYSGLADEKIMLYECYDEFTIFGQQKLNKRVQRAEIKLVKDSDLILATSEKMVQNFDRININTHYFSNAVDFALFNKTTDPDMPLAEGMKGIAKPVIGFTGNFSHHGLDFALLEELITNNPNWSFVFIGECGSGTKKCVTQLRRLSNAYFLGWKNYYKLPEFLKGFDVAIMPYKVDRTMQSVNPNKLYQFMAAGIPVVSTPMPEVMKFRNIVEIGDDAMEFSAAIKRIIAQKEPDKTNKLVSVGFGNSWENRANMALALINEKLTSKYVKNAKTGPCQLINLRDCEDSNYKKIGKEMELLQLSAQPIPARFIFWFFGKSKKLGFIWSRQWEYPWALVNADLRSGHKVLDVGCGNSPLLPYLSNLPISLELFGIDLRPDNTRICWKQKVLEGFGYRPNGSLPRQRMHKKITYREQSMTCIKFASDYFDKIFCISVIEHLSDEDAIKSMKEMARVLKPEGLLIITLDLYQGELDSYRRHIDSLVEHSRLKLLNKIDWLVDRNMRHRHTYEVAGIILKKE